MILTIYLYYVLGDKGEPGYVAGPTGPPGLKGFPGRHGTAKVYYSHSKYST